MTEVNIQNLDIKDLIEQNNTVLRDAIRALKILSNQAPTDNQVTQVEQAPQRSVDQRNYPGYTTPAKFAFMQQ